MYSAASEIDIMQDINGNGSLVTKFSRTNRANNQAVNIRGISKNGKALVRQTIENKNGRVYQKNYALPETHIMELLTKGSTSNLMENLGPNVHMKVVRKSPKKVLSKKVSSKKVSPKKKSKKVLSKKVSSKKVSPKKVSSKKVSNKKKTTKRKSIKIHKKSIPKKTKSIVKKSKKSKKKSKGSKKHR